MMSSRSFGLADSAAPTHHLHYEPEPWSVKGVQAHVTRGWNGKRPLSRIGIAYLVLRQEQSPMAEVPFLL